MWKCLDYIAGSFDNLFDKAGEKFEKHENTIMTLVFMVPIIAILIWLFKALYWTISHHGQGLF